MKRTERKMAANSKKDLRVNVVTGVGTACFPHVFESTVSQNDKKEDVYEVMILIPKSDTATIKKITDAAKAVAKDKFGEAWTEANMPLRDGDKEKNLLTEDGTKRGEKYPERLGHLFFTARSKRSIPVFDKDHNVITDPGQVYAGAKIALNVDLYPYTNKGNMGVGVGLNGVMKVADGEPIGGTGGPRSAESLFGDVAGLEDFESDEEKPKKAKKGKKKAKV